MDTQKYELTKIGITKDGLWFKYEGPISALLDDTWNHPDYCTPAILSPDRNARGIVELHENQVIYTPVDVVFPVLHGKMGEDGKIQGLLELSGIPYVGCGLQSSVLCMDKELAYRVVQSAGVMTPRFNTLFDPSSDALEQADSGLTYPLFVKPANSGSSFGITKVSRKEELPSAIDEARKYDRKVLIEEAVIGAEIGCAVLGNGRELTVGEVDQVELSHGFFRIHQEEKPEVESDNSTIHVPAHISPEARRSVQQMAKTIYSALGCSGLARVDMFLTPDGHVVLNEVNTMPGFTSYSRYPRMMAAAGIDISQIVNSVIDLAFQRKE
jgi:D-alanine--D-alanine ligase